MKFGNFGLGTRQKRSQGSCCKQIEYIGFFNSDLINKFYFCQWPQRYNYMYILTFIKIFVLVDAIFFVFIYS